MNTYVGIAIICETFGSHSTNFRIKFNDMVKRLNYTDFRGYYNARLWRESELLRNRKAISMFKLFALF